MISAGRLSRILVTGTTTWIASKSTTMHAFIPTNHFYPWTNLQHPFRTGSNKYFKANFNCPPKHRTGSVCIGATENVHRRRTRSISKVSDRIINDHEAKTNAIITREYSIPQGDSYSSLTLLEHIHLLCPDIHEQSGKIIQSFISVMGFGLDPRSVGNCRKESGVVFVNCGPSQLHLNDDGDYCRKIQMKKGKIEKVSNDNGKEEEEYLLDQALLRGFEIGLRYDDLGALKERLASQQENVYSLCSYEITAGKDGREVIQIKDFYGRSFVAREAPNLRSDTGHSKFLVDPSISSICQQKVLGPSQNDISLHGSAFLGKYGVVTDKSVPSKIKPPLCKGLDYIEFFVPVTAGDNGATVEKIARFYDYFLDAPTTVVNDGNSHIAIIGFGKIDDSGRAEQSLLFREVKCQGLAQEKEKRSQQIVNGEFSGIGGHHVAMYVGASVADFEVAASNFVEGGLMWVNPQFEDRVMDVESAVGLGQFRFKDIIDVETRDVLYVLEHEVRSVRHEMFPGKRE